MKRRGGVLLLVLVLCFAGCAYLQDYVDMAKTQGVSGEYQNALDAWTRSKTVHSEFATKAMITATLKSRDFNQAYRKEYERIYRLKPSERKTWEETQAGLTSDFTEFLFYAYTPDREANDFDKGQSSWQVFMIDPTGKRIDPIEIRRIEKITPVMEAFYPYIRKYYGNFYSLKFAPLEGIEERTSDPSRKPFTLVMTGVEARVELQW